jgi:hypothetical protein
MYDQGEVVKENKEKAFIWYLKAAEQGDSEAQLNVGEMYDQGNGVVVDKAKAFEWCQKAAQQGVPEAMKSLCGFYKEGQGVEKDLPLATYWMIKHWFTSERFNTIKSEYNQLFEFMPSILASYSEFQKVISITFVWNGSNGDSYFLNLAKFIKVDSKIQILNFECLSNLNDFQANVIAEALKFNTQLTDWQWYRFYFSLVCGYRCLFGFNSGCLRLCSLCNFFPWLSKAFLHCHQRLTCLVEVNSRRC